MTPRQQTLNTLIRARVEIGIELYRLIGVSLNHCGADAREGLLKSILDLIDETIQQVDKCDCRHE